MICRPHRRFSAVALHYPALRIIGEHGEQSSHGAACGRGQIECLGERHESYAEMLEFLERAHQIGDGPPPAIQTPHHHNIDFTPSRSSEQSFAQLALGRTRADLFDLDDDHPAALDCVFAQGADLQRQCLLIVRGNAGVQANPKGVAKNLAGLRLRKGLFSGHFRSVEKGGRKLMIMARLSSFEIVPRHPR